MEDNKTLGARIQAHRRRMGISQEQLAERLGVSRQAVSKWELEGRIHAPESVMPFRGFCPAFLLQKTRNNFLFRLFFREAQRAKLH